MGSFRPILGIVARRSMANRRLLATVVVGIVLSSALMASVVLYSDSIRDLGLKHALETQDPLTLDIQVASSSQPARREESLPRREKTASLIKSYAGSVVDNTTRYGRSATFFLTQPGQKVAEDANRPRAHFQFVEGISDHVRLTDGKAPRPATPPADPKQAPSLEVWLGKAAADQLGVKVGDSFELHPFWKLAAPPVTIVVAGLVEPKDANERYWFGKTDRFIEKTTSWPTYPFIVGEEAFSDVLANYLPDMDAGFETYAFVDVSRINSRNAQDVENSVGGLETAVRQSIPRSSTQSNLAKTISTYRTKLFFTRLPLFALMVQVVGIVLYYLVMVATMLVERQSGEIALLKSRGASTRQIVAVYGIEGFVLCGAGAIAGPLVAVAAISILGLTPPFQDLSHNGLLDVPLSMQSFGMAFVGAMLAFAALLWPAYRAAANTVIDHKRQLARPPQQSLFLRYYLDLVLVAAGAFAFYELRQRGSLVTEKLFGDLSADPLLLISPTLFMLMMALVFLRLFPIALRLAAWVSRGLNGATVALGLARMVRSPLHYSRLILLLLLATAVGMFAAGFRATLERSYDDRASYRAGAEGRLEDIRNPLSATNEVLTAKVKDATGANAVTPVVRAPATYTVSQYNTKDVTVLGVQADRFDQFAFWRGDFADDSLSALLKKVQPEPAQGAEAAVIPANSRFIGVWAQFPLTQAIATLGVRLIDPAGVFWEYRLTPGPAGADGWQFFQADLSRPIPVRVGAAQPPALTTARKLDAIYVRITGNPPQVPERVGVVVDDLQATDAAALPSDWQTAGFGAGVVVEPFENIDRYEPINGASSFGEPGAIARTEVVGRSGKYAARVAFTRERLGAPVVGLRVRSGVGPLPVVTSSDFLAIAKKKVGDQIPLYVNRQYIQVRLAGTFDLFPGYNPVKDPAMFVADLAALQAVVSRVPALADTLNPNEAWIQGARPGTLTKEALLPNGLSAEGVFDRAAIRAQQASDPLIAASWEGILFLSFAAVLALTALGFAVYATLAAQARALEFAILRTMGYSSRQILALVTFEQAFVIVAGVAVGTLLGFPLGRLMIGYLGVTDTGAAPLPPLVSQVSWSAAITVYSLLGLVFVGTIASLATVYSRLAVHRALRIGEV